MLQSQAALCVVNTRHKALELFLALKLQQPDSVFHLSTTMCPTHRLEVIQTVHDRLKDGQPCWLISTQLVEAGVDLDFPLVLRELAPLEAIIQAAGRCNREGRLNRPDGEPGGQVVVFRAEQTDQPADLWYKGGISVIEQYLELGSPPDIHDPAQLQQYFRRLYPVGELDACNILPLRRTLNFPAVEQAYRLIDDSNTVSLVVANWDRTRDVVSPLLNVLRYQPSRSAYRKLAPHQVNLFAWDVKPISGAIETITGVQAYYGPYDNELGLIGEAPGTALVG